jgi:hypothetical protein
MCLLKVFSPSCETPLLQQKFRFPQSFSLILLD